VALGHVCVLPVRAAGLAGLVGHTHGAHDESSAGDSVHGASCEAVRSTFAAASPALAVRSTALVSVATHVARPRFDRLLPTPATSPPLFLLHASLLI